MKPKTKICVGSFSVCLALSLIILICFAAAYFTTLEKSGMDDGQHCKSFDSGDEDQHCPDDLRIEQLAASADEELKDKKHSSEQSQEIEHRNVPITTVEDKEIEEKEVEELITQKEDSELDTMFHRKEKTGPMEEFYVASMLLGGVGDALGYHRGSWEFNRNGQAIHDELEQLGGLENLSLEGHDWIVSDDTVMHIATAKALVKFGSQKDKEDLYKILAKKYIECMDDMNDRAPGATCMTSVNFLESRKTYTVPFDSRGGGSGAAMRAMCIGLRYPREEDLDDLIAVSIESGRMTHHHPTGYLGAFAAALFTSYAIQRKPVVSWGKGLMTELQKAKSYIGKKDVFVRENLQAWSYFEEQWNNYLRIRKIENGDSEPVFDGNFDVKARDAFYKGFSFSGWAGASGHDAPMIAYDALLASRESWKELCLHGMLHGGDSDSTGTIAGAWFGALYGLKGVPEKHYRKLEYRETLEKLGRHIYTLAPKELKM